MGTRNILTITIIVPCVAGVVAQAVARIKAELLPLYPQVDDVIGLGHRYGCGVVIDAPDEVIPIRTLRNGGRMPSPPRVSDCAAAPVVAAQRTSMPRGSTP